MDERTIHSPLSGTLAGLPFHRMIDKIVIFPTTGKALFGGRMPLDTALAVERANRLPWETNPKGAHAQFCDGTCDQTPGANCPKQADLARGTAGMAAMGESLLAEIGANFESMDEAERATDPRRIELAEWWRTTAEAEIDQTVDKAVEYGATDLIDIGRNIARLAGREVDDQEAAELGIFFYLEGKFARWRSAIMEGRPVSKDTLLDIGVYVRMAQRVREFGSWPGTE
jgi:hypothetical protein